jgi:hypothetical protein
MSRNRDEWLVRLKTAAAKHQQTLTVVRSLISFPRDFTVRRTFRLSYFLAASSTRHMYPDLSRSMVQLFATKNSPGP